MNAKKKIASIKSNKKIKIFLLFLLLSSIFWLFSTLSDTYSYLTSFSVSYPDIPQDLIFQKDPVSQVSAQIEATGFTILGHKLSPKNLELSFSKFKHAKGTIYYFLPEHNIPNLQKQLSDSKIIRFVQDTITLDLGKLKTKKIPIIPVVNLVFKPGFKLREAIALSTDSIQITGTEKLIDSIQEIKTKPIELVDIEKDFSKEVELQLDHLKLTLQNTPIILSGKVDKFTEGTLEIPIQISHLPKGVQMEIFPKTTLITYEVSFADYAKVNTTSFTVSCVYPNDTVKEENSIPIQLVKKPDFITTYSLQNQSVNYLIKK